jgi:hypothetical protein
LNALVVEELQIDKNTKIQVGILVGTSDSFRMLSGSTTYSENGEKKMETNYGILKNGNSEKAQSNIINVITQVKEPIEYLLDDHFNETTRHVKDKIMVTIPPFFNKNRYLIVSNRR